MIICATDFDAWDPPLPLIVNGPEVWPETVAEFKQETRSFFVGEAQLTAV